MKVEVASAGVGTRTRANLDERIRATASQYGRVALNPPVQRTGRSRPRNENLRRLWEHKNSCVVSPPLSDCVGFLCVECACEEKAAASLANLPSGSSSFTFSRCFDATSSRPLRELLFFFPLSSGALWLFSIAEVTITDCFKCEWRGRGRVKRKKLTARCRFPFVKHMSILHTQQRSAG